MSREAAADGSPGRKVGVSVVKGLEAPEGRQTLRRRQGPNESANRHIFYRPLRGLKLGTERDPRANARGYLLLPLRGSFTVSP